MAQNIVRLDEGEEKMEKNGERAGKKRQGDAPQGSRVTNEKRV